MNVPFTKALIDLDSSGSYRRLARREGLSKQNKGSKHWIISELDATRNRSVSEKDGDYELVIDRSDRTRTRHDLRVSTIRRDRGVQLIDGGIDSTEHNNALRLKGSISYGKSHFDENGLSGLHVLKMLQITLDFRLFTSC